MGRVKEEKRRRKKIKKKTSPKKEDPGARKGRKVAKHCDFPMIGSKSRLAKAAGAEPAGQMRDMRDEKLHAVVARSTFPSQNAQSTSCSERCWKLRCRKSARRCGAKHISKSKVSKSDGFGALLEVEMSKKCTPLWREAHFEVKLLKDHFLTFRSRFAWQAQGIVNLVKSEQNVRVLWHLQKRWQAWGI